MCLVVNIHSKERYTVYGGRTGPEDPGLFGNQFIVGKHGKRGECVKLFNQWFLSDKIESVNYRERVRKLIKSEDSIGCFCKPRDCHCDILAFYVNSGYDLYLTRKEFGYLEGDEKRV